MPAPMPVGGLTMASVALTAAVIGNAYYQKKQFYPSVVYITKSNPSMAAIYLLAFTMVILLGKFLKKVFFGSLRAAEFEHLIERSFYAVTETCLAFTVFRDDFSPKFVALFTVLLFLKAFHWLADYRVDFMERSPIITLLFHIRVTSLLRSLIKPDLVLARRASQLDIAVPKGQQNILELKIQLQLTVDLQIAKIYDKHSADHQDKSRWTNLYTFLADIHKAFLMIKLKHLFTTLILGLNASPFILNYIIKYHAYQLPNDELKTHSSIDKLKQLSCNSNSEEIRNVMKFDDTNVNSKRGILSQTAKIFDPLSLAAPCLWRSW
ncbi:unnamed protein product, partial [Meganyctiphanes norvegica]